MAKTKEKEPEPVVRARSDAYTGMLAISFLALVGACVLLYLDFKQYPDKNPPAAPNIDVPGLPGKSTPPPPKGVTPKGAPDTEPAPTPAPEPMKEPMKEPGKEKEKDKTELPHLDIPTPLALQKIELPIPAAIVPTGSVQIIANAELPAISLPAVPLTTASPIIPAANNEPALPALPIPSTPSDPPTTPRFVPPM